jgi:hypothetical protein
MLDVLKFIFEDFWHFAGTAILLVVLLIGLTDIVRALVVLLARVADIVRAWRAR